MAKNSLIRIIGIFIILSLASFICFGETDEQPKTLNVNMSSPGFSPSMTYQNFGNGESVNTASGGLTVVHNSSLSLPQNMGASLNFTRVYNSKNSKDAYEDGSYADDEIYPNWGFLGPGWKTGFGRVFLRVIRNTTLQENVPAYFYEDEYGTEHRLHPAIDRDHNAVPIYLNDGWVYPANQDNFPYRSKWYRTTDGSFIFAKFTLPSSGLSDSYWTVFFPDGSKKVCGGSSSAFVEPLRSQTSSRYCRNEEINGWYATTVSDKVGNEITVTYRPYDLLTQPYAGSISSVIDQLGRETTFIVFTNGPQNSVQTFNKIGLLSQIVYPDGTTTENYEYSASPYSYNDSVNSVMLEKVTDPQQLETIYLYQRFAGTARTYLNKIFYPTGAESEYIHEHIPEFSEETVNPERDVVSEKILHLDNDNELHWTWNRDFTVGPIPPSPPTQFPGFPVIVKDPYGVEEAHCFTGSSFDEAGVEYYVIRFKPGKVISSNNLKTPESYSADISFIQKNYWNINENSAKDGMFVRKVTEKDYSGGSIVIKTTRRESYDLWGHYDKTLVYSGESDTLPAVYKEATTNYYLNKVPAYGTPTETLAYDLTLLDTSSQGGEGKYKAAKRFYNLSGMLSEIQEYYDIQPGPAATLTSNYRSTTVTYYESPDLANGNPKNITYSNVGTILPGNSYSQTMTWKSGALESMKWNPTGYYEFFRGIDEGTTGTGRIQWEEDSKSLRTTFYYDDLGRLTTIQPPAGDVPTSVEYPLSSIDYTDPNDGSLKSRNIGNVIRFYRGIGSVPDDTPSSGLAGLSDSKAMYTYYEFDSLGRLWRTSTVMPDNSWSTTDKLYDPFGGVAFESFPYRMGTDGISYGSISFPVAVGSYSGVIPKKGGIPYGIISSPFENATLNIPFPAIDVAALDPFLRTRWTLKPDGGKTRTDYMGLETQVTVFDIQTGPRSIDKTNSTTRYYKDIFGRLVQVDAPEGADAAYTYNGLDQMTKADIRDEGVNQTQTRDFTYNALGQLLQSKTPERGTINYLGYDARGNLLKMSDGLAGGNYTLDYTYDCKGRVTKLKKSTSACPLKAWEYDNNFLGKVSKAISYGTSFGECYTSNVEEYFYENETGRLSQKNISDMGKAFTVSYGYDDYGMVKDETRGLGQGTSTINYGYLHGRLGSALFADSQKGANKINYYPSGGIKEICISNECEKKISYGEEAATGRLSNINYMSSEENLWTTGNYSYDGAGNITGIGNNNKYYHDALSRLTIANVENPQGTSTTQTYDFNYFYDGFGNMTERQVYKHGTTTPVADLGRFTAVFNQVDNRMKSFTSKDTNTTETLAPGDYDANGNQLKFGGITYTYDVLNRLKTGNDSSYVYYYGADDERIAQISKSSLMDGESTYYLKEGGATTGELHYKMIGSNTTSIREKYFLYVGGNMLASSEKEYSMSVTTTPLPQEPVDPTTNFSARPCIKNYANGIHQQAIVSLSDVVAYESNGQKFDASYTLGHISDDIAGVMVRIARIKDQGNSNDNGNGCPRNDEDKVEYRCYVKEGLDADFVFGGFGLCGNEDYGTITAMDAGQVYPVVFTGLQKDKPYRVTLYAWTSWASDPNLGFNIMKVEEGQLLVPKKSPSTFFEMRGITTDEGQGFTGKLRAKWGQLSGTTGYNVKAIKNNGESVILNGNIPITGNSYQIDEDAALSMGVASDASYQLEAIIIDPTRPIIIGPIRDDLLPIKCPGGTPTGYSIPTQIKVKVFTGQIAYISWDKGQYPAPYYKVFQRVSEPGQHLGQFVEIGVTDKSFFVYTNAPQITEDELLAYSIQPLDEAQNPVTDSSFAKLAEFISVTNSAPWPRNMSMGDGNRLVEVKWRGCAVESTQGPFGTSEPITFDSESGLYYELLRGYNPSVSATGCDSFSLADFTIKQTTFEPHHEDTQFSASDENPLVAYKVRINYEGNLALPESDCKWTHVGYCYERPYVEWIHGYFTGSYDDNGAPIVTLEWSAAGPYSTTVYDLWRNGQYDIYDVTGTSITFAIGGHPDSPEVTHEFGVRAVNLYDGCLSDLVTCTVTVPGDLNECPSESEVGEILLKSNIVGPVYDDNGELVGIKIQLVWSGETGSYVKIFRSFEGCKGEFEEIDSVPVSQSCYYDILQSGQIAYYYVEGRRSNCNNPIGKSECLSINVSPLAGLNEGTVYFYVRDHLGSSRLVLDVDGNIQSRFNYEPYGVELTPLGANTTNEKYKYTGQERDYDTGLDYMHFRYYASSMGRFMKPDNMITNAMNPQSWNLYSYVNNSPINFNDPIGHTANQSMAQAKLVNPATTPAWFLGMTEVHNMLPFSQANNDYSGLSLGDLNFKVGQYTAGMAGGQSAGNYQFQVGSYTSGWNGTISTIKDGSSSRQYDPDSARLVATLGRAGVSFYNTAIGMGAANVFLAPFTIISIFANPLSNNPTSAASWIRTGAVAITGGYTMYRTLSTGMLLRGLAGATQVTAPFVVGLTIGDLVNTYWLTDSQKEIVGDTILDSLQDIGDTLINGGACPTCPSVLY